MQKNGIQTISREGRINHYIYQHLLLLALSIASNTTNAISFLLFWVENLPCDKQIWVESLLWDDYTAHFSIIVPTAVHKEAEVFSHEN